MRTTKGYSSVTFGQGSSGTSGADGALASGSVKYSFDVDTNTSGESLTYPGAGNLKFNNTNLGSATEVFFNSQENGGVDLRGLFRFIDDSTNETKFIMKITKIGDESKYVVFSTNSAFTESSLMVV